MGTILGTRKKDRISVVSRAHSAHFTEDTVTYDSDVSSTHSHWGPQTGDMVAHFS